MLNEVEGRGWGTSMGRGRGGAGWGRGKWHSYRKFIGNQPAFKKRIPRPAIIDAFDTGIMII